MKMIVLISLLCVTLLASCGMDPSLDSQIVIDTNRCIGATCRICEKKCPYDAIHFYGADNVPVIDPDKCISCGICVDECPVDAISGRKL